MAFIDDFDNFEYLVWDTETEGVRLDKDRPWQIAYLHCRGNKIIESVDDYLDLKDFDIDPGAAIHTGFKDSGWEDKKRDAEPIIEKWQGLIGNENLWFVGHNILGYDVIVMRNLFLSYGYEWNWDWLARCIDTLCLAKAMRLNLPIDTKDFLCYQFSLCNEILRRSKLQLGQLGKEFDIDVDESKLHDALEDIRLNKKVFNKLMWKLKLC